MSIDDYLGVSYELVKSENFDGYMKALEVSGILRKVSTKFFPIVVLTKIKNKYTLTSALPFKKFVINFKLGEPFEQETPDGRCVKSLITVEGNTLKERQEYEQGKVTWIERTFSADALKMVLKIEDVEATRTYKRRFEMGN